MKRILIYSTAYHPFVGGAEVAIKEITDRLSGDYEFEMITALMDKKLPRIEQVGNITVHRVGIGWPKFDKLYLAACGRYLGLKLHQQRNFEAVWALMASFGGFAAVKFKQQAKVKYLLTLQEGDPIEVILKKASLVRNEFNKIFTLADALQPISNYLYQWGKDMGFKGELAEVIPNGVAVSSFAKAYPAAQIAKTRDSFGFLPDAVVIVTVSRLEIKNGLADVIKALTKLPASHCFYICGIGSLDRQLKNLVTESGLERRVHFGGFKTHQELPAILQAADIFIRPSLSEGLGNAFLEAMAAGLPTIGTLVGGIPDFLTDGVTGIVCEPGSPESIARAIKRATELSIQEKQSLHKSAMELIEKKYNWEYIAERMGVIFNKLLA